MQIGVFLHYVTSSKANADLYMQTAHSTILHKFTHKNYYQGYERMWR